MGVDLNALLGQIGRDKGIDKNVLVEAVESAMLSAARKHYGHNLNLETQYDEDTGEIELMEFKVVVDQVEDASTQIELAQAREQFDSEAMVGDELGRKLDTAVLGRIAAQTAKQVIIQKVRDAERDIIYEEYKGLKGELINGIVQRYDRGNLIVNLGRTEAALPQREQISKERYRQGDRVRGMILDIDRSARGPQIIMTRSHPDFLKKLFELEVPEIPEGIVEIKGCAREPGERAKIAVYSNDPSVDPVGACVGIKGSRVQAVVQELRGERIDIVTWTADEPSFVARALAPAEVTRVVVDEDVHSMEVIVADDQLSLAIGRRGQNVKLASKLSGWKIDVRSVSVADEEAKKARMSIESIPDIGIAHAELLFQEGYRSAQEVADAPLEELLEIKGIESDSVSELSQRAKDYVATLGISDGAADGEGDQSDEGQDGEDDESDARTDLDKLPIGVDLRERLLAGGFGSIQALVSADDDHLTSSAMLEDGELETLRTALDGFLGSQ